MYLLNKFAFLRSSYLNYKSVLLNLLRLQNVPNNFSNFWAELILFLSIAILLLLRPQSALSWSNKLLPLARWMFWLQGQPYRCKGLLLPTMSRNFREFQDLRSRIGIEYESSSVACICSIARYSKSSRGDEAIALLNRRCTLMDADGGKVDRSFWRKGDSLPDSFAARPFEPQRMAYERGCIAT